MHLYLFARGKFEQVEVWKSMVQAAFWKWRRINQKTGEEEISLVQGALRQSVLGAYEYVFPNEALPEVCNFLGITKNNSYGFGGLGLTARHSVLRKMFGARKIPASVFKKAAKIPTSFTTQEFERGCNDCKIPGVAIHLIGIKNDKFSVIRDAFWQEML